MRKNSQTRLKESRKREHREGEKGRGLGACRRAETEEKDRGKKEERWRQRETVAEVAGL